MLRCYAIGLAPLALLLAAIFRPPWPDANQAILDAIYQWKYEPVVVDGVSVPVCGLMTINICWS